MTSKSAIDLNYFPKVIRDNWRGAFAQHFKDDLTVQSMLWLIKTARDHIAHPGDTGHRGRIHQSFICITSRISSRPD